MGIIIVPSYETAVALHKEWLYTSSSGTQHNARWAVAMLLLPLFKSEDTYTHGPRDEEIQKITSGNANSIQQWNQLHLLGVRYPYSDPKNKKESE